MPQPVETIYAPLDEETGTTVIDSICPACYEQGQTRIMLTKIPYFRNVVISSFSCEACGHQNNDIQAGTEREEYGSVIQLEVINSDDLDRQVIRSSNASISIPSIELEIPATLTSKGISTTVEGVISAVKEDLESDQPLRKHTQADIYQKIESVIASLGSILSGNSFPFKFIIKDASGLSHIESPYGLPSKDPHMKLTKYKPTMEELNKMGYYEEQRNVTDIPDHLRTEEVSNWDLNKGIDGDINMDDGAIIFQDTCGECNYANAYQRMCEVDIPGFRKCFIMAFVCDRCGYKSTELKPSGDIGDKCMRWKLVLENDEDLNRDVLKSNYAKIYIPDLDFTLESGSLGGVFTTMEGLISKIVENMETTMPFYGDSAGTNSFNSKWHDIMEALKKRQNGSDESSKSTKNADMGIYPWEFIIEDPADHSFIGKRQEEFLGERDRVKKECRDVKEEDNQLTITSYDRTPSMEDDMGLTDMKVEGYEQD